MGAWEESAIHIDGVLRRESDLHPENVVILTIHHCSVNDTCAVRGCDEVSSNNCPCRFTTISIYSIREEWFVGLTDQF